MKKIEIVNCTVRKDIKFVFFGKFVTALVQKQKQMMKPLQTSKIS